jgi:hypothetical protein
MSVPLHREEHEGGCPINMAVRGPCQRPSSPPHDTVTDDGEVIALVFPDVKDDLRESARQRDPGDFLARRFFTAWNQVRSGPGRRPACVAARTNTQRSKRLPSLLMCPARMRPALARMRGVKPT